VAVLLLPLMFGQVVLAFFFLWQLTSIVHLAWEQTQHDPRQQQLAWHREWHLPWVREQHWAWHWHSFGYCAWRCVMKVQSYLYQ
jgi:hypothetical protein